MSDLGGFSMFDLFREEAETHCASLEVGLLQLESDPGDSNVAIEPLMRVADSVKGTEHRGETSPSRPPQEASSPVQARPVTKLRASARSEEP